MTKALLPEYTERRGPQWAEKELMLITAPLPLDTIEGSTALVTLSIELMLQSTRAWNLDSPFSTC